VHQRLFPLFTDAGARYGSAVLRYADTDNLVAFIGNAQ
jgi:hypothetical protein